MYSVVVGVVDGGEGEAAEDGIGYSSMMRMA